MKGINSLNTKGMISVCLAGHNGSRYIKKQVESILKQLGDNDELIISDDGSTDNTLNIVEAFADNRIKIVKFKQPDNNVKVSIKVALNFQNALIHAKGDFIFLSDQDDFWLPTKVEDCMRILMNCDLVVHNFRLCDEDLRFTGVNQYSGNYHFNDYFALFNTYYGCTMAFSKHVLSYALPFPQKLELHDFWLGIISECLGKVLYIDKPLIDYRIQNTSVSHASKYSFIHKISYRMYILKHLLLRVVKFKFKLLCQKF